MMFRLFVLLVICVAFYSTVWSEDSFHDEQKPYVFSFEYVGESVSLLDGGVERGSALLGLGVVSLEWDIAEIIGGVVPWKAYVSFMNAHGESPTEKYVGDFSVVSNLDTDDSARLFEAWLEWSFYDESSYLRLGQIAVDETFWGADAASLLANSTFGWSGGFMPGVPAYPVALPGVQLGFETSSDWRLDAGVFRSLAPAIEQDHRVRHGYYWNAPDAESTFAIAEVGTPQYLITETTQLGIKGGYWIDSQDYTVVPTGVSADGQAGLYGIAELFLGDDYGILAESEFFLRLGRLLKERGALDYYWDMGWTAPSPFDCRPDDRWSLGYAVNHVREELGGAFQSETVSEANYLFQVKENVSVQAYIQYIGATSGPSGASVADAKLLGIRVSIVYP